jgi:UDP-N-acetylenolpyruvoylglucosamine reductase
VAEIWKAYEGHAPGEKKIFILGGGANVLFPDEGYDGLVLKFPSHTSNLSEMNTVRAGAGAKLSES